jgi:hypothetical protein
MALGGIARGRGVKAFTPGILKKFKWFCSKIEGF